MSLKPKSGAYGLLALCAFVAWSGGSAWAQLMSPIDPTHKDCAQLSSQYAATLQSLHDQMRQCMKSDPVFGQGTLSGSCGSSTLVAWVQCDSIARQLCRVQEARDQEMETCNQRAQARAERERKKAEEDSKTKQRLADWGSRYKEAREIVSLVKNPTRYLRTRLAGHAHVQRLMFRSDGTLDKSRAQQLYMGLHDFATTGKVSANPLIGQIQREAFRDIGIAHADTMRSLDKLLAEMRTINADLQGTRLRPPPAPRPPPVAQPVPPPATGPASCGSPPICPWYEGDVGEAECNAWLRCMGLPPHVGHPRR